MPSNIPMDTTELYIDGNQLNELSGHSFIGRKNLKVLFANNSNIQVIYNTTFHGLRKLTQLHLEQNRILRFVGHEFGALENLRELYLQNNRISYIDNRTFMELRKLEVLRLDNNKLMHFEIWQLSLNPYLVEIGLADNNWSCECSYLSRFRGYLQSNSDKIFDSNRIACAYNNMTSIIKEKNGAKCALKDGISTIVQAQDIENLLPLLLAATCAFVGFFGLIVGVFCYRHELKVWAHSNCLAAMCYKSTSFHQHDEFDKDRLYDAYISYSLQDEHFVNQILANTLENNVGYRLCLHYRDFNINTYVADTIVEAVESSKRTVLVLSRNFLYNEWSRFEFKSAIHEIVKRRRKLVFILYGDLPQRDIDADMRMYLRTSTCIEWDDKKFWQKLRMALPHMRRSNHCLAKRSAVNIYATTQQYNTTTRSIGGGGVVAGGPLVATGAGSLDCAGRRMDCNNYATINDCGRNCDKYDSVMCKYSTSNERQHHQHVASKTLDRQLQLQHEYAVPANCLKGSFQDFSTPGCDRGGETFECTAANKLTTLSRSATGSAGSSGGSACSSNGGGSAGVIIGGVLPATNNVYSFNSSQNCNCNNSKCSGDECCNQNLNCTLSDVNCIDRRLPQAMWA